MLAKFTVTPCMGLQGELQVPGDKSISHRALILGAIAQGVTTVHGFLFGADNLATLSALRRLGVQIDIDQSTQQLQITGVGKSGLAAPKQPLEMGNSGTAMRLMMGLLCAQPFTSTLTGDSSLTARPMQRIVTPLQKMGARINLSPKGTAPVTIIGQPELRSIRYVMPMASAQVKSAVLLAGLYAPGKTEVVEPAVTRDHTERMLRVFSYGVNTVGRSISIEGGGELKGTQISVPADISSAAFFMVAATITPGSKIKLKHVGLNSTRIGVISLLTAMGAKITVLDHFTSGQEPIADLAVETSELVGITIGPDQVALAIDELPVCMIAAACAKGVTRIRGAKELRVKETDRLSAMAAGLKQLGIRCQLFDDGIDIEGGCFSGGVVKSYDDHRIAMAFAVAGCVAKDKIAVLDCENVTTSFPNFTELARTIGLIIE